MNMQNKRFYMVLASCLGNLYECWKPNSTFFSNLIVVSSLLYLFIYFQMQSTIFKCLWLLIFISNNKSSGVSMWRLHPPNDVTLLQSASLGYRLVNWVGIPWYASCFTLCFNLSWLYFVSLFFLIR